MVFVKIKAFLKQFGIFYLAGIAAILGIKLFYSNAGSDELLWILAPTAWWARALSGIAFEYQPHVGYVSHACRFVIASSCSGVQFIMIAFATLLFSYIHRMKTAKKGLCWLTLCLVSSYLLTVFVNGIRIVLSIYLPMASTVHGLAGRLGPKRFHTVIGIAVYFTSLFVIYQMAGWLSGRIGAWEFKGHRCVLRGKVYKCAPPVFWYFFIVLGIPFLNGAFQSNPRNFVEYAALMTVVCFIIVFIYCFSALVKTMRSRKQNQ